MTIHGLEKLHPSEGGAFAAFDRVNDLPLVAEVKTSEQLARLSRGQQQVIYQLYVGAAFKPFGTWTVTP